MTPEEFKKTIAKLELTQEAAGEFFGSTGRQGQRWATGEREVPLAIVMALKLMLKHRHMPDDINRMVKADRMEQA